jgi:hypothetical protein
MEITEEKAGYYLSTFDAVYQLGEGIIAVWDFSALEGEFRLIAECDLSPDFDTDELQVADLENIRKMHVFRSIQPNSLHCCRLGIKVSSGKIFWSNYHTVYVPEDYKPKPLRIQDVGIIAFISSED